MNRHLVLGAFFTGLGVISAGVAIAFALRGETIMSLWGAVNVLLCAGLSRDYLSKVRA